jgi:hypothetical protein
MEYSWFIGPVWFALQLYPDNPYSWYADRKKTAKLWGMDKIIRLEGQLAGRSQRATILAFLHCG